MVDYCSINTQGPLLWVRHWVGLWTQWDKVPCLESSSTSFISYSPESRKWETSYMHGADVNSEKQRQPINSPRKTNAMHLWCLKKKRKGKGKKGILIYFHLCVCLCAHTRTCTLACDCVCLCPQKLREDIGYPLSFSIYTFESGSKLTQSLKFSSLGWKPASPSAPPVFATPLELGLQTRIY